MSTPFPPITHIQAGDPVSASITSTPDRELEQRTDALKSRVDSGLFGSTSYVYDAPVTSDTVVGMPVVLLDGFYQPAVFQMDGEDTNFGIGRKSWVCGVVARKSSDTVADIAIVGLVQLTETQLQQVSQTGEVITGPLFLSAASAGKLVASQPPVGIQVALCDGPDAAGSYTLLISPSPRNITEAHIHYRVALTMVGVDPADETAGWINTTTYASWFSTNNITIPAGATRFYYPTFDSTLSGLWPPRPITAAEVQRNGVAVRDTGTGALVTINDDGIWYLSSTYLPDASLSTANLSSLAAAASGADRMDLVLVRRVGRTNVISSLTPKNASITLTNAKGVPATSGALVIGAQLVVDETTASAGHQVVKTINGDTATFTRGVILEGIKVGTGLTLTGGTAVTEASGDPVSGYVGGRVQLDLDSPLALLEGNCESIAVDGVDLVNNGGVYGLTFTQGRAASVRGAIRIPIRAVPVTGALLSVEVLALAKANGTLPDLNVTYRKITRPSAENVAVTLPGADTSLAALGLSTAGAITAGTYVRKSTATISVAAGDLVYISISRAASDGFAGDLSLLDLHWTLTTV